MNKGKKEKKDKKEKLDEMADTAADVTDSILYGVEVASHAVEAVTTIAVPFAQFIPLIRDVTDILNKVTDLYRTAQHNKNITEVLMERIAAANSAVQILQAREDFFNSKDYTSLQRLVQVLQKMKKYIEEITQFNTVQKFLGAKSIERQYKELCNDYDSSISLLNFTLTVGFKIDSEKEDKILKEDIEELLKFQTALAESIADVGEKMTSVDEKIVGANDKVELVIEKVSEMQNTIEKVSEMQITMQNLMNNQKNEKGNQDKIDIIFNESLLPFEDYEEADEPPRKQYKSLVNRAVDQNPGRRPIFSKMLTDLKDIFNNYTQHPISRSGSLNNGRPPLPPPVRKLTVHTIAAADEDCAIDFNSINSMSLEKAIDEHKKDSTDKKIEIDNNDAFLNQLK
ncbi:6313_t:CDS:2 [Funneliformis caledonium]|uniref:6313_t:CDS:1 n=1 Tax=Funneliformis caledonium TaxID=1117310 RepID=A0A9N8V7R4_9GLOM|nr:6313_t:CDS:2 [Funneliformis caledonium]